MIRWHGPVSMSIYCPGEDYASAVRQIMWYRECSPENDLISDFVAFHLFFDGEHIPQGGGILGQEQLASLAREIKVI